MTVVTELRNESQGHTCWCRIEIPLKWMRTGTPGFEVVPELRHKQYATFRKANGSLGWSIGHWAQGWEHRRTNSECCWEHEEKSMCWREVSREAGEVRWVQAVKHSECNTPLDRFCTYLKGSERNSDMMFHSLQNRVQYFLNTAMILIVWGKWIYSLV